MNGEPRAANLDSSHLEGAALAVESRAEPRLSRSSGPTRRPVLAAIDFSPLSEKALLWAVRAARSFGAPLVVLHVVHDHGSAAAHYERARKRNKQLMRIEEAADETMSAFLHRMRDKHPALAGDLERRLVVGLPTTRILEVAKELDAHMIVMGSRGRNGLPRILLGSKAGRVAQRSPIPVTVVKDSQPGE